MNLTLFYQDIAPFRDMLRRPEWCCSLHTRVAAGLIQVGAIPHPDGCGSGRRGRPLYEAVRLTPQEIDECRDMLRRPEWCCALHTKMLDFLEREDVKAHLEMEARCLAAYDAGDRTTLTEVIEALANDPGR